MPTFTICRGWSEEGLVDLTVIDEMVANILRVKFRLGLFENPYTDPSDLPATGDAHALDTARRAALQSVVLLKNDHRTLPLSAQQLDIGGCYRTDGRCALRATGNMDFRR